MICRLNKGNADCMPGLTCYALDQTGEPIGYCAVPNGESCFLTYTSFFSYGPCKFQYGVPYGEYKYGKVITSKCINNVCAAPNGESCNTGAGCQSGLCYSNSTCVSFAVSGTKCATATSCGANLICTGGFCQAPSG
jgi:hypothetical protein